MNFKQIQGNILYRPEEKTLISHLKPLEGHEWEGKLPGKTRGSRTKRDKLKKDIKKALDGLQGDCCCFCGLKLYETSGAQIEHIVPKDAYPEFMFTEPNMALACSLCNGFDKKGKYDTIDVYNNDYNLCTFKIVHPYMDDPAAHYSFAVYDTTGVILNFNTPKAIASKDLFDLDGPEQTLARGKMYMHQQLQQNPEIEKLLDEILQKKHIGQSS